MGIWSLEDPIGGDTAADLMFGVGSAAADTVDKVLNDDYYSKDIFALRAAAWLVIQLGDAYVWDVYRRNQFRKLADAFKVAITRTELEEGDYEPEWIAAMREEHAKVEEYAQAEEKNEARLQESVAKARLTLVPDEES